ncbi:TPA: hypothetical protein ACODJ5_002217 [Salmonella enterica subsp. salamae serovar 42:g,t:-]
MKTGIGEKNTRGGTDDIPTVLRRSSTRLLTDSVDNLTSVFPGRTVTWRETAKFHLQDRKYLK